MVILLLCFRNDDIYTRIELLNIWRFKTNLWLNTQVFCLKQNREGKKYKLYKFMCSSSIYTAQEAIFYKQFMSSISV